MKCVACGLDNDPALRYCDNCESPLSDAPPPAGAAEAPRPAATTTGRPVARTAAVEDDDEDFGDGRGGEPDELLEPRSLTRPLAVGGLVLLVAIAVGGVFWAVGGDDATPPSTTLSSPDPGATAPAEPAPAEPITTEPITTGSITTGAATVDGTALRTQAQALDQLLSASKKSRDKLNQGIKVAGNCARLSTALTLMRQAGDERRAEQTTLASLDLSAITAGEQARSALTQALRYSIEADEEYVKWAETKSGNGCRNSTAAQRHFDAADRQSDQAGAAKSRFLELWNPVAAEAGLPPRDRQGI